MFYFFDILYGHFPGSGLGIIAIDGRRRNGLLVVDQKRISICAGVKKLDKCPGPFIFDDAGHFLKRWDHLIDRDGQCRQTHPHVINAHGPDSDDAGSASGPLFEKGIVPVI